jgi:hypothetical protein
MNLLSSNMLRAAVLAIGLPLLGVSATVNVNGGTTTYNPGTITSGSFNQAIFVGSDEYFLSATYAYGVTTAQGGPTTITFLPTVTYIGGSPTTSADTINFNLLAGIFYAQGSSATTWDGTYTETVPLLVPTGATASGELFADGQGVGLVGPYGPGTYNVTQSANLTGVVGQTLNYAYDFTFTFGLGTPSLTSTSSPASSTPEPATMIPAAIGLVGFGMLALRRRKQ